MDTIYALSTGPAVSGVAVVRVSGAHATSVSQIFDFRLPDPRRAEVRRLVDLRDRMVLDHALVLFFPGPRSFTGEDVVELHLHGSRAIVRAVLHHLSLAEGFRAAAAGEFTRRSFLSGKMDLLDVEAMGDVLRAETLAQARLAETNRYRLRQASEVWRTTLLELRGLTEALIDFSDEDDVIANFDSALQQKLALLTSELDAAAEPSRRAEILRDGFRVALMGAPNSGKSSLLNALAQRDVAIVSDIAGTTRDLLEVHLDLAGYPVILVDTAGFRLTEDVLEREGIARTRRAADTANFRIWLSPVDHPEEPGDWSAGTDLIVDTKSDLFGHDLAGQDRLAISVVTGQGLPELVAELAQRAKDAAWVQDGQLTLVHDRQRGALKEAADALRNAGQFGADQLELRAESLRLASKALDRLIGRIEPDQVLDVVFSRFCIGK
jgi:tRNA modification GTPase